MGLLSSSTTRKRRALRGRRASLVLRRGYPVVVLASERLAATSTRPRWLRDKKNEGPREARSGTRSRMQGETCRQGLRPTHSRGVGAIDARHDRRDALVARGNWPPSRLKLALTRPLPPACSVSVVLVGRLYPPWP